MCIGTNASYPPICKKNGIEVPFNKGKRHISKLCLIHLNKTTVVWAMEYVAILYVIRQYFRQQPIVKKEVENEIRGRWSEIVETLVRWSIEDKYYYRKQKVIIRTI